MVNNGRIKEVTEDMKILLNGDLGMRLYNVYYVCKAAMSGLKQIKEGSLENGAKKLIGWHIGKQALESLFDIDFIKDDAKKLYNILSPIDREESSPDIGSSTFMDFMALYKNLISKLESVVDLYESMKDGISQPGIDIKIPPCNSLKEYIKILDDIDFVFTQCPYFINDNERIEYKGTDVGSDWITFTIVVSTVTSASFVILNNLASIINKAISLKSNKRILDMQEETYKAMQLKNEVTQDVIDAFNKMKQITYKNYVDELQEELGTLKDGDEEGRVSKSLEKLANLIDKGVEIHTSIETPKEIKVLFPFAETQQTLPDNLLKFLEDKASQNSIE